MELSNETRCLLGHLHRGGAWRYTWTPDTGEFYIDRKTNERLEAKHSLWSPVSAEFIIPAAWDERNVYFGVHPSSEQRERWQRSMLETIAAINCLFGEYDAKDFEQGKVGALAHVRSLPIAPSIIIDSGGGYHCYWLLVDTVVVDEGNRARIRFVQHKWVNFVGSDNASKDLTRVLRVPGGMNRKGEYAPDYPEVVFVDANFDCLYDFEDLVSLLPEYAPPSPREHVHIDVSSENVSRYARQALQNEIDAITSLPPGVSGQRNATLNKSAYSLGQLVGEGVLEESIVVDDLTRAALAVGLNSSEAFATINSGLRKGKAKGRVLPASLNRMNGYHPVAIQEQEDPSLTLTMPSMDPPVYDNGYTQSLSAHDLVAKISEIANDDDLKEPDKMHAIYSLAPQIKEIDELNSRHIEVAAKGVLGKTEARDFVRACIRDKAQNTKRIVATGATESSANLDSSMERFFVGESADDEGNSLCVHHLYGEVYKFCPAYGWMKNLKTHWLADSVIESEVNQCVTDVLKTRRMMAVRNNIEHMIGETKPTASRKGAVKSNYADKVTISSQAFDSDKDLLNCRNGVINLRTGELLSREPSDMFTYCINAEYHPDGDWEYWTNFLSNAVGDYEQISEWLQMACGYSITGHTKEEIMFYLYGPTRSGKGTFTNAFLNLLGSPLSRGVSFSMFTKRRDGDAQNFDLAPLKPARFVSASESGKYQTLNEAAVKQITGNDPISACFKHKDEFTFFPQFKVWLSSNHPVKGDVEDDAFWGRVKVIEFPNSHLGKEDKTLKETMQSDDHMNALLSWSVFGASMWYGTKGGLITPQAVGQKTQEQRSELDTTQRWLDECVIPMEDVKTSNADLYQSYYEWCEENGEPAKKANKFGVAMSKKGYEKCSFRDPLGKKKKGYTGIGIIA